jgi:L-alanine-DL-glutamate epimerase-like enolase superfamily enzyme
MEEGMDILLLVLHTSDGAKGVAETSIRLKWHSASVRSFVATLEDVFIPVLRGVDLADEATTNACLSRVREHPLAKSLIDAACWDLRAGLSGQPLWKKLGASSPAVPVSFTITRAAPDAMIAGAQRAVTEFGIRAFKIKTGQTLELDRAAVHGIRAAVGPDVELFADSNGGHPKEDVPAWSQMLAEADVLYFEDPCGFLPNKQFQDVRKSCTLPILVDNGCRSLRDGILFIEAGAEALSVKTMKTGLSESLSIADRAKNTGCKVSVGISATSALGAVFALSLASAFPDEVRRIPCEETFFLTSGGYLNDELRIQDGCVHLPSTSALSDVIDWRKVDQISRSL